MSYRHLSIIERSKLEVLHRQGRSSRAIAKELSRHPSTICRELDRVTSSHPYQAEQAQNAYEERRKTSVSPGNWSDALAASLEEKLEATWSPEQITERFRIEGRCPISTFFPVY
ncbi:helix-turn-helix domain-containing protein [Paenibacillus sp. FSL R7-0026]|uniref:helix-turn-helix domain-containing protein n=1 Tax=Paenibacillus sp. FSL R7-0026 TaxID=2921668 RepID=UPI0030F8BA1C